MANLKLPDIEPARSFKGAEAQAIEGAGAAFDKAMQSVARIPYELDKARLIAETTAASDKLLPINRLKNLPAAEPTLTPKRVQELFGGEVPPEVRLTERITGPDGKEVERPRSTIPTHEVYPQLFERTAQVAMANAKAAISSPGWANRFEQAAKADIEKARQEAYDFTIAQHRQEMKAKGVARADELLSTGQFKSLEALFNQPEWGWTPAEQEKALAEIPKQKTDWNIRQVLQFGSEDNLREARAAVLTNEGAPIVGKLSPTEQMAYTKLIDGQLADIEKARYQGVYAKFAEPLIQIRNLPPAQRRAALLQSGWRLPEGHGLKPEDATSLQNLADKLLAKEDVQDNIPLYVSLAENGWKKLKGLTREEMVAVTTNFSDERARELARIWGDLQEPGGKPPPSLTPVESGDLDAVLEMAGYKNGPLASADERALYNNVRFHIADRYIRTRRDPNQKNSPTEIFSEFVNDYKRGSAKTNVGDTGYLDMPVDRRVAASQVLGSLGAKNDAYSQRQLVLDYDAKQPAIEAAWGRYSEEPLDDRTGMQIFTALKYNRAGVLRAAQERIRATGDAGAAAAEKFTRDIPDDRLIEFLIETKYATPEGRARAEAARAETQKRADNTVANAAAKDEVAARLKERQRLYDIYLKQNKVIGPPSARGDILTFEQWLTFRGIKPEQTARAKSSAQEPLSSEGKSFLHMTLGELLYNEPAPPSTPPLLVKDVLDAISEKLRGAK